jgi:hypothetical protein
MDVRVLAALLLAAASGLAQPTVVPRLAVLRPGQSLEFQIPGVYGGAGPLRWSVQADDGGPTGTLDPFSGRYTAPGTTTVRTIRITATRGDGSGSAQVTLLPDQPFGLLDRVLGPGWLEPYSRDLPFVDLATGLRFPAPGRIVARGLALSSRVWRTGLGQPLPLEWQAHPDARGMLLSWREGAEVVRRDVTGQAGATLTPHDRVRQCQVEALVPVDGRPGCYRSLYEPFQVQVRGLLPWSGSALAEPGHADGTAAEARYHEPWSLARITPSEDPWGDGGPCRVVVADRAGHVVRLVDPHGRVSTPWGKYGRPGHRDTGGVLTQLAGALCGRRNPGTRLRGPTHLALPRPTFLEHPPRKVFVSDSGNHVIRALHLDGRVRTVAGRPGRSGHRDGPDPAAALFDDPRGLACDPAGRIYVADRGNHVLRVIESGGPVTTLAGSPGQPGTRDGMGDQARFSDLKAMVFAPGYRVRRTLLVLDGHAVRAVDPENGEVTTILGQAASPGFQDALQEDRGDRERTLAEPCLRDPADLLWLDGSLYLADAGNHAVRCLNAQLASLHTVAGDPAAPQVRWGLLRDGMPVPLTADHAALAAPRALALGWEDQSRPLLVATGSCLAALDDAARPGERKRIEFTPLAGMVRNRPFFLGLGVEGPVDLSGADADRPGRFTVEFREADGTLGRRVEAQVRLGQGVPVEGWFTQPGQASVVVYYLSPGGVSAGLREAVTVSPGP